MRPPSEIAAGMQANCRRFIAPLFVALALAVVAAGCGTFTVPPQVHVSTANYEVWTMDQTNNIIHIISPQLELVETVDLSEAGLDRLH